MLNHQSFAANLEQVSVIRHQIANYLEKMADILNDAETQGEKISGKLALNESIKQLETTSKNLRQSKFRLLVLGDVKRGKSTFINALLGEPVLPSDVNPCTALLTIVRYGEQKQVTIYFKDNNRTETINLASFKQKYTIDANEAKLLAESRQLAFPNVDYAVVEYPLDLLKQGLEIIDSPGLNDTEARNELTLQHIYHCHGVLFLFKAMQPCTLEERRYLKNHLPKDITTFFIINAWDEIKTGLVDPEDTEELAIAQSRIRQVFQVNLNNYMSQDYDQRVFEVSSLAALRQKLKNQEADLVGTGFPEFLEVLNSFLNQEKAVIEFKQAQKIANNVSYKLSQAVDRRIPLLDESVVSLKQKIAETKPEFEKLRTIRNSFEQEIEQAKDEQSKAITDSFANYILKLEQTFEADFLASQPELNFADFLDKNKRNEFQTAFKKAFERYINDRLSNWEFTAKQQL